MNVDAVFPIAVLGLLAAIVGFILVRRERRKQNHSA